MQFGYTQWWEAWQRCMTECVWSWLEKANDAPQAQWKCRSLCWYLCRTKLVGLLKALVHSSQYNIPCFCWWWTFSKWALSRTSLHSLHPYLWCRFVFFNVNEWVAKLSFPFGTFVPVSWVFAGRITGGAGLSSMSSISFSTSTGGSCTLGIPVEVVWACTHEAVGPSAGGVILVRFGFYFLLASLEGVLSL